MTVSQSPLDPGIHSSKSGIKKQLLYFLYHVDNCNTNYTTANKKHTINYFVCVLLLKTTID